MKNIEIKNEKKILEKINLGQESIRYFNHRTKWMNCIVIFRFIAIIFLLGNLLMASKVYANVNVTTATGGNNISADKVSDVSNPYTPIGNIVISEGAVNDFRTTGTLILNAPSGWIFNTNTITVSETTNNLNITNISIDANSITIAVDVNKTDKRDVLTISGIQVKATDGYNVPGTGNITASGTLPTGLSTTTNLGTLSQKAGALNKIVVTLPGETFNDGTSLSTSGNSGTPSTQTAGTAFNISLTATDQFYNKITTYTGAANITAGTGVLSAGGTTAAFSAGVISSHSVNFSHGGTFTLTASTANPVTSTQSNSLTVNNPIPTISSISPTAACTGSFTLTVNGTNFNSSSAIKLNNTNKTTSYVSSTQLQATIAAAELVPGSYTVSVYNPNPGGGTSASATLIVTNSWLGTTSNWNTASNWCSGIVPDASTDVVIPSGVIQPVISSSAVCKNITINSGAILTIGGTNTLSIKGNWTNNGTFTANSSTVILNGTAQTIGNGRFNNLTISGSGQKALTGITVNGILSMEGTATVSSAPTYGSAATLQYNTVTDRTNGPEWLSTFTSTGGVKIINTGKITLDKSRVYSLPSLSISAGNLTIPAGGQVTVSGATEINPANGLTIESAPESENGTGSFITGSTSGPGTASVIRYMTPKRWHLVASPLSEQTIGAFLRANESIPTNSGTGAPTTAPFERGMRAYDVINNSWGDFLMENSTEKLTTGKGFSMRVRTSTTPTGTQRVTFTGQLQPGEHLVIVTPEKWNCIGNPYTSAIGIALGSGSTADFLTVNEDILDPSFGAIYVWNQPSGDDNNGEAWGSYKTISNATLSNSNFEVSTDTKVQQGQAFMVKIRPLVVDETTLNITFNKNMQLHQTDLALKSTDNIWPTIQLQATANDVNSATTIAFHEGMTNGLDVTYDAGLLKAHSPIDLYTRLVDDYGIPFAIQALPSDQYDQLIIPVGVDYPAGGTVSFSAKTMYLPSSCRPILEDRLTGILTDLSDKTYTTDLSVNTAGTGRFYLHTSYVSTEADSRENAPQWSACAVGNHEITINGKINNGAVASLYDLQGRLIATHVMREGIREQFSLPAVNPGIYLLKVRDQQKVQALKVLIGK